MCAMAVAVAVTMATVLPRHLCRRRPFKNHFQWARGSSDEYIILLLVGKPFFPFTHTNLLSFGVASTVSTSWVLLLLLRCCCYYYCRCPSLRHHRLPFMPFSFSVYCPLLAVTVKNKDLILLLFYSLRARFFSFSFSFCARLMHCPAARSPETV